MPEIATTVFVELAGETRLAGRMWTHRRRKSATFVYSDEFVSHQFAYPLDPRLPLGLAPNQADEGQAMFGAFADCAPDRWGPMLIDREEARRVKAHGTGAERRSTFAAKFVQRLLDRMIDLHTRQPRETSARDRLAHVK
ncbi:MAG: hypothetical protein WAO61_09525 [Solirubrobacterales bacterium]